MAFGGKASPYEVRCSQCDVSFAPETRTCVHCGGPTGMPGYFGEPSEAMFGPDEFSAASTATGNNLPFQIEHVNSGAHDSYSMSDASGRSEMSPYPGTTPIGGTPSNTGMPSNEDEAQDGDESESIGQSLFKSLGSVIWVVLLIGFSLVRSCGNE